MTQPEHSLRHLAELPQRIAQLTAQAAPPHIAVVWPTDDETAKAILHLHDTAKAHVVAVGQLHPSLAHHTLTHLPASSPEEAAHVAVAAIRAGRADVLMKGHIASDVLMRAILHKGDGLMLPEALLTHVAVIDAPHYHKLLFVSDVAVLPTPTLAQRHQQIDYLHLLMQACSIYQQKLALIHFNEQINAHFPLTLDYQALTAEAQRGAWHGLEVFGPLDVGTAINAEAARLKGLVHPVCGDADALIMPTLEAGNVFYKAAVFLGRAATAGVLMGACCPVVLNSRADSWQTKCSSLDLALLLHLHTSTT